MTAIHNVIVGTAGHIDHGKSTLVRALTGVDPDRLAEERERGMTIDLGFAPYRHRSGAIVGLIDVPGHERFIKNMVAGATSVDIALLVVAADDGVMPQTREHLEILGLLGVTHGLTVVTKVDLVEPELCELACEDATELARGTFLERGPLVRVSATTGAGLDALRASLDELVERVPPRADEGPFRLPVQRVFSAKGHGLVVTGVPVSGRVAPGDVLEIVGSGRSLRVRRVHAYGAEREAGRAGHSAALNLAGASKDDVRRGDVVATPGSFRASRFVTLAYEHVTVAQALRHRHPVRLHVGTAEVLGRASLLDGSAVERGVHARVQVRLEQAVVTAPGDRALLRDAAAMGVLGGGLVLATGEGRLKRFKPRVLEELERRRHALGDPLGLALAALEAAGTRGRLVSELARELGCPPEALDQALEPARADGRVVRATGELHVSTAGLRRVADDILAAVEAAHGGQPLLEWLDRSQVRSAVPHADPVFGAALERDERFELAAGGRLRRRGWHVELSAPQRDARARILERLRSAGSIPPAVDGALTGLAERETQALLDTMRRAGEVVSVQGYVFHADVLAGMRRILVEHASARQGEISIPELRDALGTTRKFLIPLLEHFDAEGLTVRHGDRRVLRQLHVE